MKYKKKTKIVLPKRKKEKKYGIPKLSKRVGQSARLVTTVAGANIMISTAKGLR